MRCPKIWPGKTEMVNAALAAMPDGDLLWEVDADEQWSSKQIQTTVNLFAKNPDKTSALFCCKVWVGPDRYIYEPGKSGNHLEYEWRRVWRFNPGWTFKTHEPPAYGEIPAGINHADIKHDETMASNLIFNHLAYVNEAQVAFKERYYKWPGLVEGWRRLQSAELPCLLRDYMPQWANDDVRVVGAEK
jgi:hypothetical protein